MSRLRRIRNRFRLWRRARFLARQGFDASLREFIYLDEVSVYSLIASKLGPLAAEFTEVQARSMRVEGGGNLGVAAPVDGKFGLSAKAESSTSTSTQVLRKANVQATFKELYEYERAGLALGLESDEHLHRLRNQRIADDETFHELLGSGLLAGGAVPASGLARGLPIEVRVCLDIDPAYRLSRMFLTFEQLATTNPAMFAEAMSADFRQAAGINRVLEHLMAGLIPLRSRLLDYVAVDINGSEYLVHEHVLANPYFDRRQCRPIYLVGVAEQTLFWKDIRRVLFAAQEYRVMARLSGPGLKGDWVPMKLVEAVADAAPELARQLNQGARAGLSSMRGDPASDAVAARRAAVSRAVSHYADTLASRLGTSFESDRLQQLGLPSDSQCDAFDQVDPRRTLFDEVTSAVVGELVVDPAQHDLVNLRAEALAFAGLDHMGRLVATPPVAAAPMNADEDERLLEAELVAMYW